MSTDWVKFIAMRFVQILLSLIFLVLIVITAVGLFSNKPIKIWGLEFNVIDTVYITKHDTISLNPISNKFIPDPKSFNLSQKNSSEKNEANQNYGTNYGNIGDDGTIINNERYVHPDVELIKRIEDSLENKITPIYIKYEASQQKKNMAFCKELIDILKNKGYQNIKLDNSMYYWNNPITGVEIYKSDNHLILFVNEY